MHDPADTDDTAATRLERALELFLAHDVHTGDGDALLAAHPELRELLEPMLRGDTGGAGTTAAEGDGGAVLGDYRLVRELGRGGMGTVYEAWQRSLDRRIAVKVLNAGLLPDPAAVARFHREATAAARLRHPHIVEVFDFGATDGRHWYAMQLVEGEPLHHCRQRFADVRAVLRLGEQIAAALAHAHDRGVVHRDVKPGNILVRPDGTALLTDFGVASDATLPTMTHAGGFVGTPDYAAPEQLRGERVDARADVWSLGVVMAELVTGVHPFAAPTRQAMLRRMLDDDPHGVATARGLSPDLRAVLLRALAKAPAERYQDAEALRRDLHALQHGASVSARLPTAGERLRRWARREPWRATAAMLVLLGLAAGAGTFGYLSGQRPWIEAGQRRVSELTREQSLGRVWLAIDEGDLAAAERALAALPERGEDVECRYADAWLAGSMGRHDEAAKLLRFLPTRAARLLAKARGYDGFEATSADDTGDDPLAHFTAAWFTFQDAEQYDDARRRYREAALGFQRAAMLSPTPRVYQLLLMLAAAARADDRELAEVARSGLAHRALDTDLSLRTLVQSQSLVDPAGAVATLERALAEHPRDRSWLALALAEALMRVGRADEALAVAAEHAAGSPDDARAFELLGRIQYRRNAFPEAVSAATRATELFPDDARCWHNLGLCRHRAGDVDGAAAALQRAISLQPDYAKACYNLGRLAGDRDDWQTAADAYRRALAIEPDYAKAQINLATALWRLRHRDAARVAAARGMQLAPDDPVAVANCARFAYNTGDLELAQAATDRWRQIAPDAAAAFEQAARLLLRYREQAVPLAFARIEQAIALAPDDPEVRLLHAFCVKENGDLARARALIDGLRADLDAGRVPAKMRERLELLDGDMPPR